MPPSERTPNVLICKRSRNAFPARLASTALRPALWPQPANAILATGAAQVLAPRTATRPTARQRKLACVRKDLSVQLAQTNQSHAQMGSTRQTPKWKSARCVRRGIDAQPKQHGSAHLANTAQTEPVPPTRFPARVVRSATSQTSRKRKNASRASRASTAGTQG